MHLFIFFIDQSFPLISRGQWQRKIHLAATLMLLKQTRSIITSMYQSNIQSAEQASVRASWPLLPAFFVLHDHLCHFVDALGSVVFIMCLLCHFLQVLHVCPHQHVPQQQEVRVNRILHWHMQPQQQQQQHACMISWTRRENTPSTSLCNDTFYYTPGIGATSDPSSFTLHLNVTPNYCKRDTVLQREGKKLQPSISKLWRRVRRRTFSIWSCLLKSSSSSESHSGNW